MQKPVDFKRQREFGDVISDTFLFIKQNFKPLIIVFATLCGFFLLAGLVSSIIYTINLKQGMSNPEVGANPVRNVFSLSYFTTILFYMLTYASMTISTLSYISLYMEKGNVAPTLEEVWSYFKYFFLRVFGSTILISIIMVAAFMCCLIPGIYVFPALSIFFSVMIFENGSFGYSFGRAFKLANSDWWMTAATMVILWVITYAALLIPSIPSIMVNMAGTFAPGSIWGGTPMIIFSTIIQYVFQFVMIFPVIGVALCYFNLTEKLENGGLLGRIQQLGRDKEQFNSPEEY